MEYAKCWLFPDPVTYTYIIMLTYIVSCIELWPHLSNLICRASTGVVLSVVLFFLLSSRRPPHWAVQCVLALAALLMSMVWLYLQASEVVAVLESFGLIFRVDTGTYVRCITFIEATVEWVLNA